MAAKPRRMTLAGAAVVTASSVLAVAAVVLAAQGVVNFVGSEPQHAPPPTLTAFVTVGEVVDQIQVNATVEAKYTWPLEASGIVTRDGLQGGQTAAEGDIVAVVDERPIFVLQGSVPMYRPLGVDSSGDDVRQLQEALQRLGYEVANDGRFGFATARAVFAFYTDRGYTPVGSGGEILKDWQDWLAGIPQAEVTFAPALPVVATTSCGRARADAGGPMCTLTAGQGALVVEAPKSEEGRIMPGLLVHVTLNDGTTADGQIAGVHPESSTDAGADDEEDESATEPARFRVGLAEGQILPAEASGTGAITIEVTPADTLRIEAAAIREDVDGAFWLLDTEDRRIDIEVGLCNRGLCAIDGKGIRTGLEVVVPGEQPSQQSKSGDGD